MIKICYFLIFDLILNLKFLFFLVFKYFFFLLFFMIFIVVLFFNFHFDVCSVVFRYFLRIFENF